MRHLSVPVNIRLIYLVFRVYATILHIEYENLFFPEDCSDIVIAESDAEHVKLECLCFHLTAPLELQHKVPSFIHDLLQLH